MTKSIDDAATVAPWKFDLYVEAEADGVATSDELAVLEADRSGWRASLQRLLLESEEHLSAARNLRGEERDQVLADAQFDHRRFAMAWARFHGEEYVEEPERPQRQQQRERGGQPQREEAVFEAGVTQLQLSREPGRVVAWGGGNNAPTAPAKQVVEMLASTGAPSAPWTEHAPVTMPNGDKAHAVAAPVGEVLGWLVAAGAGDLDTPEPEEGEEQQAQEEGSLAPSVCWLGRVAVWAVELAARGAMVPLLRQRRRREANTRSSNASYSVRWTPALIDGARLNAIARAMPGAVAALETTVDARAVPRSALTGMVDAIGRQSARLIEVPAAPPVVRSASDVTEAFLARFDGSAFDAPTRVAGDLVQRAEEWARSVTRTHAPLVVRLDAPDDDGVWHLAVFQHGPNAQLVPIEHALAD